MAQSPRLNYPKTFLLGFGFFGVSVANIIYNTFVPLFLANRFGLEAGLIGFFMSLDNIAAFFIQPGVGAWSDRLRTRWGRRIPFIVLAAPLSAAAFGLIPVAAMLPLFVACTISFVLSMAVWRTPVVALMPDITPSQFRSPANGVINFMGGVGGIIATLVGGQLADVNAAYPFWLGSALVLLAVALVFIFIKEPTTYDTPAEATPGLLPSLRAVLADPDPSAQRLFWAILCWFVGYNMVDSFFSLYAVNHLGLTPGQAATLLSSLILLFIIFALPAGYIGLVLGRRTTILAGLGLMIGTLLVVFALPAPTLLTPLAPVPVIGIRLVEGGPATLPVMGALLMLLGVGWALININSLPMVVDMTDMARVGTYTGLYYLFSTLAAILGPNVMGWVVQATGNNYANIMLLAPLALVAAFGFMLGVRSGEARPTDR